MSLPDPIERETAASPRWLSIVGIGEDGVDGLSAAARGLIGAAEIVFGGRRHLSLAAPLIRGAARPWPSPFDGADDEVLQPSWTAGLRARLRRPVPLWRRRHARAPHRCARDARGAGAVGIQPRRGAPRLVAAADRAALGPRPHPRSGAPASAARRAHPGADLRRRGSGGAGEASGRHRLRRLAAHGARSARRSAGTDSRHAARRDSISAPSMRSTRSRSKSRPRPVRA